MPSTPRRPPGRATKDERALLHFTLLNPMHKDACCLIGVNELLVKVLTKATEDDPRQGPILRAALGFLSTPRSQEEHAALRQQLTRPHCNQRTRVRHEPVPCPLTEVLEVVLFGICGTISDYLMRLGVGKFRKEKDGVPQDEQPWPSRISDVIPSPGGEHELLIALAQWAGTAPGGHSVFALIGALARFWEPFAVQVIGNPGVFLLATMHLRCALDSYDPRARPAVQLNRFISPVVACAQGFFFAILEIDMGRTISVLPLIIDDMHDIAVRTEAILLRMKHPGMDGCRRWFKFVRSVRRVINPDGTFITAAEASKHAGHAGRATDGQINYVGAYFRLAEIRNRNQCMYIACTSKIAARSSVCSRCGIVRYCSPECLKIAWTSKELPHKILCTQIKNLRTLIGLSDDKAWNHAMRDDSAVHRSPKEFVQRCVALEIDMGLAKAIFNGIIDLTNAKMSFLANERQRRQDTDECSASIEEVQTLAEAISVLSCDGNESTASIELIPVEATQ